MKRIIPVILFLLTLTGCYNSGEPRERVLKIYNWADYIGDGVLEDFQTYYKEQTGENIRISKDDSSKYDKDIWMNPATVKKILKERNK